MNIILHGWIILKADLEYKEACILCKKSNQTKAAQYYVFTINTQPNKKWSLQAKSIEIDRLFLQSPEDFVIEY